MAGAAEELPDTFGAGGMTFGPRPGSGADGAMDICRGPEHHALLHRLHDRVENDAESGQYHEESEHGRYLQIGVVDQEQIAEPGIGAHELAHDGAYDTE